MLSFPNPGIKLAYLIFLEYLEMVLTTVRKSIVQYNIIKKQAGAELCQAQTQLDLPAGAKLI